MLNFVTKSLLLIISLGCSTYSYADFYNITINVNGDEYYSDENGFSGNGSVPAKVKPKSTGTYVPRSRGSYASTMNKNKYADLIAKAADRHQVDAKLLHAVIQAESSYNATAISSAGAMGLMQLMPETARRYGVTDRRDPDQNIDGGTRYLKHLLQLFDSNLNLAVAAYNAGENAVIKYNNTIPPYPETRNYVEVVLSLKEYMKRNGSGSVYDVSRSTDTTQD
jgi:soluble lytic murein transglycosylase-like protein